jgi:4-hydroxy-4-methyl-2-oxoglutarate aldolase
MPVEVGGLKIRPGDLLHGDRYGIISIPAPIARQIPAAAARIVQMERRVLEVTESPHPSLKELREAVIESLQWDKVRR